MQRGNRNRIYKTRLKNMLHHKKGVHVFKGTLIKGSVKTACLIISLVAVDICSGMFMTGAQADILNVLEQTKDQLRIAELLSDADKDLLGKKYKRAGKKAEQVLDIDPDNKRARDILSDVESAGTSGKKSSKDLAGKREKDRETRIKEKERLRREAKAGKYMEAAREAYNEQEFGTARYYAKKAAAQDPGNMEIEAFTAEINQSEIFNDTMDREEELPAYLEDRAEEAKIDYMAKTRPGASWTDNIKGIFRKKVYRLGDIEKKKIYTVDECVQVAVHRSPRMIMADEQIKLAEMRLWEARRDILPELTVRFEKSSGRIGANAKVRHYRGNKYQFEVKQNIFDGMEKWFDLKQAKVNLEITVLEKDKVVNELVEEVKKAYYSLDKARKAEKIQKQVNKKVVDFYDIADKAYQEELFSRMEFLKVKAAKMQSDFQYLSAREDVKLAEMILFQAMGMEPDENLMIKPVESPAEFVSIGLENCYELALANNPEFRIKAKTLEYYEYERKMKKARGWPLIDFDGSFGQAYENYEPLDVADDYTSNNSGPARSGRGGEPEWYAGVKTSFPLWGNTVEHNYVREQWAPTVSAFRGSQTATNYFSFKVLDNLAYFSDIQEADVGYQRSIYEYKKEKNDLILSVKEMYFKYRKSIIQKDIAKAQYENQKTMLDVFMERYKYGEIEMSRIVDETVKLAEHEFGGVQTETEYFLALNGLSKTIGLPDYFKPYYEKVEYEAWKNEKADQKEKKKADKLQAMLSKKIKLLDPGKGRQQ